MRYLALFFVSTFIIGIPMDFALLLGTVFMTDEKHLQAKSSIFILTAGNSLL